MAIDKADAVDYSMIYELLNVLREPYTDQPGMEGFAEKELNGQATSLVAQCFHAVLANRRLYRLLMALV